MDDNSLSITLIALKNTALVNARLAVNGRRNPFLPHLTADELAATTGQHSSQITQALQASDEWVYMGTGFSLVRPFINGAAAA